MLLVLFRAVLVLICIYTLRHYFFTLNRLFGRQRHPYVDVESADWPAVTVLVAAHNEEAVVADILKALLTVDYPADRLIIIPVNDRSTDRTREIIDSFVEEYPQIEPFHRVGGKPGKAAALKDAMERVNTEVVLIFDADYVPGEALIRQLVSPFFDPEIGAVMGRVVPLNVGKKLLTRLLDLERSGGYQVDQQARMNLHMVPQYGGTVAGIRKSALDEIGGWNENALAEDTDLTYRLLLAGWKTAYENRAECYEEVPERWPVRVRQIMRWAKGHNQVMTKCLLTTARNSELSWIERVDGVLLLGVYLMGPVLLLGWLLAVVLFYTGIQIGGGLTVLALGAFTTLGNFAAFFEIAAAARLDGSHQRIRLLPLTLFGFTVSLVSVTRAAWQQCQEGIFGKSELVWHKTERSRTAPVLACTASVLEDSALPALKEAP
ncbi:MAG TPA: glycosyltransferase [Verrucomicrobiae bacterium]|jgi:cellulose synthase/poly-beta-1,6-N-acetylglucosamine synthase-like glycosyltransferase|nr:glycosyltransferase [Verrucomicrobiae bacterium]